MDPQKLLPLWQATRDILDRIFRAYVAPAAIALAGTLDRREHYTLARLLRGVEAMLRTLLFIEAVELCVSGELPPLTPRRAQTKRTTRADQPKMLRVCFRMLDLKPPRGRRRVYTRVSPIWRDAPVFNAMPLALRANAALHVFNNPGPWVRRLARKLQAKPHLASRINGRHTWHTRVIPTEIQMDAEYAFADAARRLPDTS